GIGNTARYEYNLSSSNGWTKCAYHSAFRGYAESMFDRFWRSIVLWAEIGESRLIGPEMVPETTDKVVLIKERLKAERDRQKIYADNRHKPLELKLVIKYGSKRHL
nr:reverse transcriptase domain-containing protein [Tanacetum cinerariifolium]